MQNPIILGIETGTDSCSVAIYLLDKIYSQAVIAPRTHAKLILDMIAAACKHVDLPLSTIDGFAYGQGPGSFTGLRIAASVIQGLAFGLNKPVVGVSSLQALAQQAYKSTEHKNIIPMLDARMQQVYWGNYVVDAAGVMQTEFADRLDDPAAIKWSGSPLLVGTGVTAYLTELREHNPDLTFDAAILYPRAQEIVEIARGKFLARDQILTADQVLPVYVRNDVVKKIPT